MNTLLTIILSLPFIPCFGQTKHQKLIAAEYRIDTPRAGNFTYLVSYNFIDGLLKSKDTILGSDIKYDLFNIFIYKNRYIISNSSYVIDLKKKELIFEKSDHFVKTSGDSVIFHRKDLLTGTGYLMLDLKTENYNFINNEERNYDKERNSSPDKNHYLSIDRDRIPYKIWLHSSDGKKRIVVNDAARGPNITIQSPTVETHWLDNNSFIYAVHERKSDSVNKEFSKVTLRIFDIQNNSDKSFYILDSVGNAGLNGKFFIDNIGQAVYRTNGLDSYLIDTANSNLIKYSFYEKGYNFSIRGSAQGDTIKYENIEVGIQWGQNAVVTHKIIAMAYGEVGSNLAYPKGIKVWSQLSNTWTTIEVPWLSKLIGWVEED